MMCNICFSDLTEPAGFGKEADLADTRHTSTLCGHIFHRACLNTHFGSLTKKQCPTCRVPIDKRNLNKLFLGDDPIPTPQFSKKRTREEDVTNGCATCYRYKRRINNLLDNSYEERKEYEKCHEEIAKLKEKERQWEKIKREIGGDQGEKETEVKIKMEMKPAEQMEDDEDDVGEEEEEDTEEEENDQTEEKGTIGTTQEQDLEEEDETEEEEELEEINIEEPDPVQSSGDAEEIAGLRRILDLQNQKILQQKKNLEIYEKAVKENVEVISNFHDICDALNEQVEADRQTKFDLRGQVLWLNGEVERLTSENMSFKVKADANRN